MRSSNSANRQPVWTLEVIHEVVSNSTQFVVKIDVRIFKDGNAVPSVGVIFRKGTSDLGEATSNNSGIASKMLNFPLSDAGKSINLSILLKDRIESVNLSISFPQAKKFYEDPENLEIIGSVDNTTGEAVISVRVVDLKGNGLNNKVVILLIRNKKETIETDSEGHAIFTLPYSLDSGDKIKVLGFISGIKKVATIFLERRKDPSEKEKRNNIISLSCIGISFVLWIFCFYIGFGDPLISKPEVASSNWERHVWFWSFVFTVLSFAYVPIAFREEVAAAWKSAKEKIDDPSRDSVGDSFLENAFDRLNETKGGNNEKTEPGTTSSKQGMAGKLGFGRLFSIDLLAEFVMELLPKMVVKVFKS